MGCFEQANPYRDEWSPSLWGMETRGQAGGVTVFLGDHENAFKVDHGEGHRALKMLSFTELYVLPS